MRSSETRRSLLWRLGLPTVVVQVVASIVVAWITVSVVEEFNQSKIESLLSRYTMHLEVLLQSDPKAEDAILREWNSTSPDVRLTLIGGSGRVRWDSDSDSTKMENHGDRPEILGAITSGQAVQTRFSATIGERMTYVARRIEIGGEPFIIRASMRSDLAQAQVMPIIWSIVIVLAALLGVTLCTVAFVSRDVDRHVRRLSVGAERIAAGDFEYRSEPDLPGALATLGMSLDRIANDQGERIRQLSVQQSEMQGILFAMSTGVIAMDLDGHVISVNPAASRILALDELDVRGRPLERLEIDARLIEFARSVSEAGGHGSSEITLDSLEGRQIVINSEPIHDDDDRQVGTVLVLDDVTRLRQLEAMRTDFASNVSHELRTPITAIQGYAELLLDEQDDAKRRQYTDVVARHATRLSAIIEDLLSLSRLEDPEGSHLPEREILAAHELLDGVVRACSDEAASRDIVLEVECDEPLTCHGSRQLLEQAVSNLVVNAIRYGPPQSTVRLSAWSQGSLLHIAVADEGPGIDESSRRRLFERFYRIDQGRSREVGGTGLGLAIVKHIALAHGGSVDVETAPGRGSVFTVTLPTSSEHTQYIQSSDGASLMPQHGH